MIDLHTNKRPYKIYSAMGGVIELLRVVLEFYSNDYFSQIVEAICCWRKGERMVFKDGLSCILEIDVQPQFLVNPTRIKTIVHA